MLWAEVLALWVVALVLLVEELVMLSASAMAAKSVAWLASLWGTGQGSPKARALAKAPDQSAAGLRLGHRAPLGQARVA